MRTHHFVRITLIVFLANANLVYAAKTACVDETLLTNVKTQDDKTQPHAIDADADSCHKLTDTLPTVSIPAKQPTEMVGTALLDPADHCDEQCTNSGQCACLHASSPPPADLTLTQHSAAMNIAVFLERLTDSDLTSKRYAPLIRPPKYSLSV